MKNTQRLHQSNENRYHSHITLWTTLSWLAAAVRPVVFICTLPASGS